jgi:hypothetical protein
MNLFIKLENGEPINHPILEENLKLYYSDLDIENPPEGYAKFIRKPFPVLNNFEIIESIEYVIDQDYWPSNIPVYTDKYNIRSLTDEEMIQIADDQTKQMNEGMRIYSNAPYPAPDDGNLYVWSGSSSSWILKPENFDEMVNRFIEKMKELNLFGLTPEQLNNIEPDKKIQLQQIVDELNTSQGFNVFNI